MMTTGVMTTRVMTTRVMMTRVMMTRVMMTRVMMTNVLKFVQMVTNVTLVLTWANVLRLVRMMEMFSR